MSMCTSQSGRGMWQNGLRTVGFALAALCVTLLSMAQADNNPAAERQVRGLIAAGEFGAAAAVANQADPALRERLLREVVLAQAQGEKVHAVLANMPQESRQSARGELARNQMLNGGFGADFQSLIDLIQNETEGPWFDIDGVGGTITEFESGVRVDPRGVLAQATREEGTGRLAALGMTAREAVLQQEMAQVSGLRLVSLTRLEKEISARLAAGKPVVESMKHLAGLTQIQYVFVFPEDGEIVLGGPAEAWKYNEFGMAVGTDSGRPVLHLDDLVTVLRTFDDGGQRIFGCSIDPRPENIQAVREYAATSQSKGALSPAGVRAWATKIGTLLGMQDITVYGVPGHSRVARVMVEADYRMKLIGVGKLNGGPHVPSYFELLARQPNLASGGLDAMRWWMTMKYDGVLHSADRNNFEIRGSAVLCRSENQFLKDNGERVDSGKAEPINKEFASRFTQHYGELADKDPVFAELQGIFDLALVAALIDRENLDQKAGWDRGAFALNGAYHPAFYATPKQTESVVNHKVFNGKDVVLQAAGGVRGDIQSVLQDETLRQENPRLTTVSIQARKPATLPEGRWWWDAR